MNQTAKILHIETDSQKLIRLEQENQDLLLRVEKLEDIIFPGSTAALLRSQKRKEEGVETIINMVCNHFGADLKTLKQKCRKMVYVKARYTAMYLIYKYCGITELEIGKIFSKDRSMVNHAKVQCTNAYFTRQFVYTDLVMLEPIVQKLTGYEFSKNHTD
jgi:chromosomal replication initiation ATPase DnaA